MGLRRWKGGWKTEVVLTVWDPLEVFFFVDGQFELSFSFQLNIVNLFMFCFWSCISTQHCYLFIYIY